MPRLWVIPGDAPNAFATGRDPQHSSVAITEGLLNIMDERELEGVIAHELGHVKHRDILISSVAATWPPRSPLLPASPCSAVSAAAMTTKAAALGERFS